MMRETNTSCDEDYYRFFVGTRTQQDKAGNLQRSMREKRLLEKHKQKVTDIIAERSIFVFQTLDGVGLRSTQSSSSQY